MRPDRELDRATPVEPLSVCRPPSNSQFRCSSSPAPGTQSQTASTNAPRTADALMREATREGGPRLRSQSGTFKRREILAIGPGLVECQFAPGCTLEADRVKLDDEVEIATSLHNAGGGGESRQVRHPDTRFQPAKARPALPQRALPCRRASSVRSVFLPHSAGVPVATPARSLHQRARWPAPRLAARIAA